MTNLHDPLTQLKPLHLPHAISAWPPAPGWFLLIIIILALFSLLLFNWLQRRKQTRPKKIALAHLQSLEVACQDPKYTTQVLSDVSKLLKRVALLHHPRQEVAGLSGQQWLAFLDATGLTEEFSTGIGRILVSSAYSQRIPKNAQALFPLVRQWIEKNA